MPLGYDYTTGQLNIEIVPFTEEQLQAILAKGEVVLKKALYEVALQFAAFIAEEAPVDTGQLHNVGSWSVSEPGDSWEVRITTPLEYALYVYTGTRPHAAPFDPIAIWAERHGLEPGAVWYSILLHGTASNDYLDRAQQRMNQIDFTPFVEKHIAEAG